jgi:hypothetical protein
MCWLLARHRASGTSGLLEIPPPDDVATVERSRPSPSLPRAPPDAFARPLRGVTASPALTRPAPAASAASARGLAARRAFVVVVGAPIAARFIG